MTAQLPTNLAANPRLSRWLRFDAAGLRRGEPGQDRDRPGHRYRPGADRRRRARRRHCAGAHDPGDDRGKPQRGRHLRQPVRRAVGLGFAPRLGEARSIYLGLAAQRLGVPAESLQVEDGTIVGPGNLRTSYWELADDALLARDASPGIAAKAPAARRIAGTPVARLDLPDKVFGRPRFVHDLALPGLLHGRVLKPASPGAKLTSLDEAGARSVAGVVAVVRDGSFAGVVAETEAAAEAGLAALRKGASMERGLCATRRDQRRRLAQEPARRQQDHRRAGGAGGRA